VSRQEMIEHEFHDILSALSHLTLESSPKREAEIHRTVLRFLTDCRIDSWQIQKEFVAAQNRFDLLLVRDGMKIVVEIKRLAGLGCLEQLDRYSVFANGLIVVCWKATDAFKKAFESAKHSIPIALIQLKQRAPMLP